MHQVAAEYPVHNYVRLKNADALSRRENPSTKI
jgi:hypothetical protein